MRLTSRAPPFLAAFVSAPFQRSANAAKNCHGQCKHVMKSWRSTGDPPQEPPPMTCVLRGSEPPTAYPDTYMG